MGDIGRVLIAFGLIMVIIGAMLSLGDHVPWLGRLPGDVSIKREHFSVYVPLTTCLLISMVLTLLLYLFRR
jgi:hypothetical protein